MGYSLGLDGGGTKTDCILLNARGAVIGEGRGGPANPLRCGYVAALSSLRDAAAAAIAAARIRPESVTAVCAGIAGAGRRSVARRILVFLAQEFPGALAHVTTDYEVALEAAVGAAPGVILIAGTGSVAYGRNAAGEVARAGGHGPWVGDEGSAFEIGRQAVCATVRAQDGDAPVTILAEMILGALDCPDWDKVFARIANNPDDVFPKLFPVVALAADSKDSVATEIIYSSAIGLSNLAASVIGRLGMKDQEFPLVKCGGVFGHSRILDAQLNSALASGAPHAKLSYLEIPPATGAARLAARLAESPSQAASHGA